MTIPLHRLIDQVFGDEPPENSCDHSTDEEPHSCPYQEDVNNDSDYRCTCCDACVQECADDI